MKEKLLHLFVVVIFSWLPHAVSAYDFEVDGIYYNILSATDLTCEVTKGKSTLGGHEFDKHYTGGIVVPEHVSYEEKEYTVVRVGKAFTGDLVTKITLPNSIVVVNDSAFYGCTVLEEVTLGNAVTTIGSHAFEHCSKLTGFSFGETLVDIGKWAFSGCSGLTNIVLPKSLTTIGNLAFYQCTGLTSVTTPSANSIGTLAFGYCTSLTDLSLGDGVTSIGDNVFSGCSKLTELIIPNSVTSISMNAFLLCSSLSKVTLGSSVTTLGTGVFGGCEALKSVTCLASTPPAADAMTFYVHYSGTFPDVYPDTLYVPKGSAEAYKAADAWKNFRMILEIGSADDKKQQNLSAMPTAVNMTYGDDAFTLPATTDQGLSMTWTSDNEEVVSVSGNLVAIKGVGSANITGEQVGNDEYEAFHIEALPVCVGKATLEVIADDLTRAQGEDNPRLTVSYEGFVYGEDESVLDVKPSIICAASKESPVGEYDIVVYGGSDDCYNLNLHNGKMTVTVNTGVESLVHDGQCFDIYSCSGVKVKAAATSLQGLPKGLYIVSGKSVVVR